MHNRSCMLAAKRALQPAFGIPAVSISEPLSRPFLLFGDRGRASIERSIVLLSVLSGPIASNACRNRRSKHGPDPNRHFKHGPGLNRRFKHATVISTVIPDTANQKPSRNRHEPSRTVASRREPSRTVANRHVSSQYCQNHHEGQRVVLFQFGHFLFSAACTNL